MNEYLGLYMTRVFEHSSHGASVIKPLCGFRRTIPSATSRSPIAAIFSIILVPFLRVWLLSNNSPRGLWVSESTTSLLNSFANFSECGTWPRSAYRKANDTSVCLGHQQVQAVPHIINKSSPSLSGIHNCSLPASSSPSLCLVLAAPWQALSGS